MGRRWYGGEFGGEGEVADDGSDVLVVRIGDINQLRRVL